MSANTEQVVIAAADTIAARLPQPDLHLSHAEAAGGWIINRLPDDIRTALLARIDDGDG